MDIIDKYSYWEDVAEYDLETAEAMLNSGRYLYVVFMCQQKIPFLQGKDIRYHRQGMCSKTFSQNRGGVLMAQIPENIEHAVREYIFELRKEIPVQKAILFGSYASGKYTKDSDVDLAIFSDYFEGTSRIDGIKFLLFKARRYARMDFQPLPFTYRDYIERDGFAAEVIREGIEII